MNRATAIFLAAIVLALVVGHVARDTPGYVIRQADGSYAGDIDHYVYWTRLVTLGGVQAAYGGTWPETYAVYPPVNLYAYQALGNLYRAIEDPAFEPERADTSEWLRRGIKFVALGWHILTAVAIFALVRIMAGPTLGGLSAAAYVANPAVLFDVTHWGQPDAAHALFSVLAIGLLSLGNVVLPWAAIALAALAKPQAWVLLPLIALGTWLEAGTRAVVRGVLIGGAVAVVVILPFLLSGRLLELLSLPGTIASVMPVVSADAHNAWQLVAEARGVDPIMTPDSTRFVGPLTYRTTAALLVAVYLVFTYWLVWTRRAGLAEAAAMGVLGWFVLTTQAHENHLFYALPLLALAWPMRLSLLWVYVGLSLTLLLNMLLQDQLLLEALGLSLANPIVEGLRSLNAALNVAILLCWSVAATVRLQWVDRRRSRFPARATS